MESVKSPCIRQCGLNENNVCKSCFRTLNEIADWSGATDEEQRQIVKNAAERAKAARPK